MEKTIMQNIINAYMELRLKCDIETYKRFNVVIIIQPKILCKLINEIPYGIERSIENECYFIRLCDNKTPILINNELPEEVEFQIMPQNEYERIEKEKMFEKFNKMFY